MNYGYQAMSQLSFLSMGFAVVAIGAMGFIAAFVIGSRKGGRAAKRFATVWATLLLAGVAAVAIYALVVGELQMFLYEYGVAPLAEMVILACGWTFIMGFMAMSYSNGRIALDEKFGGSQEVRKAAIAQAKRKQHEQYKQNERYRESADA